MMIANKILNITKQILFLFSIASLILLVPNIISIGTIGIFLIIISIIYILANSLLFIIKAKGINNNLVFNILNNFLYLYICLVAYKYLSSISSTTYVLNDLYFQINYLIIIISMLGVLLNSVIIIKNNSC